MKPVLVAGGEAWLRPDLVEPPERWEPGQQEPSHGLPRDQGKQVDCKQGELDGT